MRVKRAKQYKKLMNQYQLGFGFRPPYQILLDAEFIKVAQQNKMRLGSMLEGVLAGEIKPMITQCCIRHLYEAEVDAGQKAQKDAWIDVAKQAERRRCGHHELDQPLSTLDCLRSVVDPKASGTNKHRYAVASQDPEVRARMRDIAGVPLVYINRSVMILEPMAAKSEQVREADEKGKIRAGLRGGRATAAGGVKRKRDEEELDDEEMPARARAMVEAEANGTVQAQTEPTSKKRKVKGPKGPNPLSVKKAKSDKPKPAAKEIEDERAAIRKAAKKDPQAAEKAVDASVAAGEGVEGVTEGPRKRRRKRKPREDDLDGGSIANDAEAVTRDSNE